MVLERSVSSPVLRITRNAMPMRRRMHGRQLLSGNHNERWAPLCTVLGTCARVGARNVASLGTLSMDNTAAGIVGGGRAVTTITYAELLEALMHQAQIIDEAPNRSKSASGFSANQHLIAFEDQEELVPYDLEEEDVVQANVYNINTPMEKLGHWKNHSNGRHKGYNVYNVRLKTGR